MSKAPCPVCNTCDTSIFFKAANMPVHVGLQWPTQDEARRCPRGDMALSFCRHCGFIANLAFEPDRLAYAQAYDNSLFFSPFFRDYAHAVASRLVERYRLYNKQVIEIGCGKGDFLTLLCALGDNRGVGFDPSAESSGEEAGVEIIGDFYSERYAGYSGDLICCRFVYEHICDPVAFLNTVRQCAGNGAVVYFEVPNTFFILRDLSIWDLIYEHCSYFCRKSLAYVFAACGFEVLNVSQAYGGQFLCIEAMPCKRKTGGVEAWEDRGEVARYASDFAANYQDKLANWQRVLNRIEQAQQRAVVWGAGAKTVSFMNLLGISEQIEFAVDLNPGKQGKYLAGTGQRIVAPEFLAAYQPDVIIVMNRIYQEEIQRQVQGLGLAPHFVCA